MVRRHLSADFSNRPDQALLTRDVKALQGRAHRHRNIRPGHPSEWRLERGKGFFSHYGANFSGKPTCSRGFMEDDQPTGLRYRCEQRFPVDRHQGPQIQDLREALIAHARVPDGFALMLGNGSDELISLLAMACDLPGATILAPVPGFVMYGMSAQLQGLKFVGVPLNADFELDEAAKIEAQVSTWHALGRMGRAEEIAAAVDGEALGDAVEEDSRGRLAATGGGWGGRDRCDCWRDGRGCGFDKLSRRWQRGRCRRCGCWVGAAAAGEHEGDE